MNLQKLYTKESKLQKIFLIRWFVELLILTAVTDIQLFQCIAFTVGIYVYVTDSSID